MPTNTQHTTNGQAQDSSVQSAITDINREFKEREVQRRARDLGIPYVDLSIIPINQDLLRIIPEEESKNGDVIVFFRVGKKLRIAFLEPEKIETKNIIKKLENEGFTLNINICSPESLTYAQEGYKLLKKKDTSVEDIHGKVLQRASSIAEEIKDISQLPEKFEQIKSDLALAILNRKAIASNASDIHFEGQNNKFRVRGRIDGTLRVFFSLSNKIAEGIIRQIKFNAEIASNEKHLPSDGQFVFPLEGRNIMVRVSVIPGNKGESIVMRYLDPKKQETKLEDLGFSSSHRKQIETMLTYKEGLVVTTGPTGSGKTTSLYAMLKTLNTPDKKIITLENPVEYELPGIIQSSIQSDKGYTFSAGLRSCLRQDPDVILVGEIRDEETAETALQASMTGHLVLSTLHTNSAIETLVRLRDLHIPDYLISSSLKGIIAQRLVRKTCRKCSEEIAFTPQQYDILTKILTPYASNPDLIKSLPKVFSKGKGCVHCGETGYKGRGVISEVLILSRSMSAMIAEGASKEEMLELLHTQKHRFLAYDGALKIIQGETDFEEVIRVLGKNFLPS